jgi:hypothetical protein
VPRYAAHRISTTQRVLNALRRVGAERELLAQARRLEENAEATVLEMPTPANGEALAIRIAERQRRTRLVSSAEAELRLVLGRAIIYWRDLT